MYRAYCRWPYIVIRPYNVLVATSALNVYYSCHIAHAMFPSHIHAPKIVHLFYPSFACVIIIWPPAPFKICYLARILKELHEPALNNWRIYCRRVSRHTRTVSLTRSSPRTQLGIWRSDCHAPRFISMPSSGSATSETPQPSRWRGCPSVFFHSRRDACLRKIPCSVIIFRCDWPKSNFRRKIVASN